jgi:hypothetical protein
VLSDPTPEQLGGIGWKGGALHPCGCTSPPSPLRTGRATRRCIRLSREVLAMQRQHLAIPLDDVVDDSQDKATLLAALVQTG